MSREQQGSVRYGISSSSSPARLPSSPSCPSPVLSSSSPSSSPLPSRSSPTTSGRLPHHHHYHHYYDDDKKCDDDEENKGDDDDRSRPYFRARKSPVSSVSSSVLLPFVGEIDLVAEGMALTGLSPYPPPDLYHDDDDDEVGGGGGGGDVGFRGPMAAADRSTKRPPSESTPTTRPVAIGTRSDLERRLPDLCDNIFRVLGCYHREGTYQSCLAVDLLDAGCDVEEEVIIRQTYRGRPAGTRRADLVVRTPLDGAVTVLELKAVVETGLSCDHLKQLQYYMHHAGVDGGYLINFPKPRGSGSSSFPSVVGEDGRPVAFTHRVVSGDPAALSDRTTRSPFPKKQQQQEQDQDQDQDHRQGKLKGGVQIVKVDLVKGGGRNEGGGGGGVSGKMTSGEKTNKGQSLTTTTPALFSPSSPPSTRPRQPTATTTTTTNKKTGQTSTKPTQTPTPTLSSFSSSPQTARSRQSTSSTTTTKKKPQSPSSPTPPPPPPTVLSGVFEGGRGSAVPAAGNKDDEDANGDGGRAAAKISPATRVVTPPPPPRRAAATTTTTTTYGITKRGTPCKNCLAMRGFCHQHEPRRPKNG